jgi:hypothetical protein
MVTRKGDKMGKKDNPYNNPGQGERYYAAGYFDESIRGLEDNLASDDPEEIKDFCHECASRGDYVEVKDQASGDVWRYNPDEWMAAVEMGKIPLQIG